MKPHSYYCQDPECAKVERRPRVGDRVHVRAGSTLIGSEYPLQPATVTKVTPMGGFCARPDKNRAGGTLAWRKRLQAAHVTPWRCRICGKHGVSERSLAGEEVEHLLVSGCTGDLVENWPRLEN